jgi:hypothetical protein
MSAEVDCDSFVLELLDGGCKAEVEKDEVLGDKINLRLKNGIVLELYANGRWSWREESV